MWFPNTTGWLPLRGALMAIWLVACSPIAAQVTQVGELARNFTLTHRQTRQALALYDYTGSIMVLDFFGRGYGPAASLSDVETNIHEYYRGRGGNSSGIPVIVISVNIENSDQDSIDLFIDLAGLHFVADDVTGAAYRQFSTGDANPLFVIINGAADATTHRPWQVLLRESVYGGAESFRRVIDSVVVAGDRAPAITQHPLGQNVVVGADVSLAVTAVGTAPLSFQWLKDGGAIVGATSQNLELPNVQANQAGDYSVRVTNAKGAVDSAKAPGRIFAPTPVIFASSELEVVIRSKLNKPAGSLLIPDLLTLRSVVAYGRDITNLQGLETATNLVELVLYRNPISDLRPLARLTALKTLDLHIAEITDLGPLATLTGLTDLHLDFNRITDLSPIAALTNLTFLNAHQNSITNLHPLASMTQLTNLFFADNKIPDVSPLRSLTNLTYLWLDNNSITNLAGLASMTQLTDVFISDNNIQDASPLQSLTNLTALALGNNPVTNLAVLSALPRLEYLYVDRIPEVNLAAIPGFGQLRSLDISGCNLADLAIATGLSRLNYLSAGDNPIRDYSGLLRLTNLTTLFLDRNHLSAMPTPGFPKKVEVLDLSGNALGSLDSLSQMTGLRYLTLTDNRLTNIAGITAFPALNLANLTGNWLDVAPGSPDRSLIDTLISRGRTVVYIPQGFPLYLSLAGRDSQGSRIQVSGKAGVWHDLYTSTDLKIWSLAGSTNSASDIFEMRDRQTATFPQRFYRVQTR